eukprot:664235-Rhodomonas_salina.2
MSHADIRYGCPCLCRWKMRCPIRTYRTMVPPCPSPRSRPILAYRSYLPPQYPVQHNIRDPTCLRACYAMSGTEIAYGDVPGEGTWARGGRGQLTYLPTALLCDARVWYGVCGTEIAACAVAFEAADVSAAPQLRYLPPTYPPTYGNESNTA